MSRAPTSTSSWKRANHPEDRSKWTPKTTSRPMLKWGNLTSELYSSPCHQAGQQSQKPGTGDFTLTATSSRTTSTWTCPVRRKPGKTPTMTLPKLREWRLHPPVGPPPQLSAQQKARLQALLKQRDEYGRAPFGLDEFNTDAEMWAAYRRSQKASYREYRKRERVAGTWTKDQQRGGHTPRGRERSPLPRRPRHQDGGEPYGEQ